MNTKHPPALIQARYRLTKYLHQQDDMVVYQAVDTSLNQNVMIGFVQDGTQSDFCETPYTHGLSLIASGEEGGWSYCIYGLQINPAPGERAKQPSTSTPEEAPYSSQENSFDIIEAERRQMAQNLNESVVSQLHLLLSQVNAYQQTLNPTPETDMILSVLLNLVQQTLQQVMELEGRLHPVTLDSLGLEAALELLANQERRKHGLYLDLRISRLEERLDPPVEIALYRITQDVLDRAKRQGKATRIQIQLGLEDEEIRFTLGDDGLPPEENTLRLAHQRIDALGGILTLEESVSGGLKLDIRLPVHYGVHLSEREHEVVQGVVQGLTNREIAETLVISPRTVKFHLDNIFSKLGVNSRTEVAVIALRKGWAGTSQADYSDRDTTH